MTDPNDQKDFKLNLSHDIEFIFLLLEGMLQGSHDAWEEAIAAKE